MSIRRRQVLKGALSLSALSLSYPFLKPANGFAAEKTTAVVIGGGLSGLNCALLLADFGIDVILLEGSNRFGGRARTADGVETRPEYGASEVGRSYARAIDLCSRLDVNLLPDIRSLLPMSNYVNGTWVRSGEWADSPVNRMSDDEREMPPIMVGMGLLSRLNPLKNLDDWLSPEFAAYDISMQELFEANGVSDAALRLAAVPMNLRMTSSLGMMQERTRTMFDANFGRTQTQSEGVDTPFGLAATRQEGEEAFPVRTIEGGTSRLPEAMAAALGDRVRLGKVVAEIDMSGTLAEIRCLDGSRYNADFVVAAIPFTTLRNITVSPGFAGRQAEGVLTLGYRGTTRAWGVIERPYWEDDGLEPSFFTDETIQTLVVLDKLPGEDIHRCSVIFTGPSSARIDQMPDDQALALIESEIARIRPATKGAMRFVDLYGWRKNPLIQGCRHLFGPGQISRFAKEMIIPHHRLHFAGEHTRRMDFGMEAALESGERAAFEILQKA
ncbi:MAG: NAD(P)/FAD-dependent oxidoreductase [Gammaproteobacteria bacterium]|nr:NAD(P)/FAD-dependent oxidoreductase [Gammaproteobacteria bacterium]